MYAIRVTMVLRDDRSLMERFGCLRLATAVRNCELVEIG
jgi:hypothetical protein